METSTEMPPAPPAPAASHTLVSEMIAQARGATPGQIRAMVMSIKLVRGEILAQVEYLRPAGMDAIVRWLENEAAIYSSIISILENCALVARETMAPPATVQGGHHASA